MHMDSDALKKLARAVISTEAAAVANLTTYIDDAFVSAARSSLSAGAE